MRLPLAYRKCAIKTCNQYTEALHEDVCFSPGIGLREQYGSGVVGSLILLGRIMRLAHGLKTEAGGWISSPAQNAARRLQKLRLGAGRVPMSR
jgi:hypothetical protein